MDLLIAFIIFTAAMITCLLANVSMVLALMSGYVCFVAVALRPGILTASWRAGGTILFFVYYGIKIITPNLFLILTFLLTCLLSYAIGTSFGVAGTLGVIFMALACSGIAFTSYKILRFPVVLLGFGMNFPDILS